MRYRARMKAVLAAFLLALPALAVPTTVTVRAVSRDAKVIGSGVGGARITIRDVASGRMLAEGVQLGGTGDTKKIMAEPHVRGANEYGGEGAAEFVASVDIDVPTVVEIAAEGPLKYPQATRRTSKTMLLVPGQHITGEGVLLEIHGFIIDIQQATAERVRIKMTMACGCPIEPAGMWDANGITITARLRRDGKMIAESPMKFAGETSLFDAAFPDLAPGTYELQVVASDAANANFGMATSTLTRNP
jgi:hypothetical protein